MTWLEYHEVRLSEARARFEHSRDSRDAEAIRFHEREIRSELEKLDMPATR